MARSGDDGAARDHAIAPEELTGRRAVAERDRQQQPLGAEADVGDPAVAVRFDEQHHVGSRQHRGRPIANPRHQARQREPELLQDGGKQQVVFEAVAAAAVADQLALDVVNREPDRSAEQDVEIFERNVRRMRQVQAGQRRCGWRKAPE